MIIAINDNEMKVTRTGVMTAKFSLAAPLPSLVITGLGNELHSAPLTAWRSIKV